MLVLDGRVAGGFMRQPQRTNRREAEKLQDGRSSITAKNINIVHRYMHKTLDED